MNSANGLVWVSAMVSSFLMAMLLDVAVKGFVLILFAMLAFCLMRRSTAAMRHFMLSTATVALLVLPLMSWTLPQWKVLPSWTYSSLETGRHRGREIDEAPVLNLAKQANPGPGMLKSESALIIVDGKSDSSLGATRSLANTALPSRDSQSHLVPRAAQDFATELPANEILLVSWLVGFLIMLIPSIRGFAAIQRLQRQSDLIADGRLAEVCQRLAAEIHAPIPRIYIGSASSMPMVWGFITGKLLLPSTATDWSAHRLRAVLLHELAHLKRRDPLTLFLGQLARAFHWFNPLVWWMVARMRVEHEQACDDFVLRHGVAPSDYASDVLELTTHLFPVRTASSVSLAMADRLDIESRLQMILDNRLNRRSLSWKKALVVGMTVILSCGGLASIHAQQKSTNRQHEKLDTPESNAEFQSDDQYAWNRTDKYVAPDFESYFPENDEEAAKRLDEFMSDPNLRKNEPDEYIDVVRRGLRSTKLHKTSVLRTLGNTFIWNAKSQNPKAIELMYHASGAPADSGGIVHYAMYFGPTVVVDRSDNLMRMMMTNHHRFGWEIQRRLNWSFKTYGDQAKTARQLESLLDAYPESLSEFSAIATFEYYRNLTGAEPPSPQRFAGLGKWAIGFSHADVKSHHRDGFQQLRDMLGQHLEVNDSDILEYVGRVDGNQWVGVGLIEGMAKKDHLVSTINEAPGFNIEFAERLDERLFQTRRLREFAKHWDGEIKGAKPAYTIPNVGTVYSWNRDDKYVAPSYEQFFPDDEAAGKRLDELIKNRDNLDLTDREILDAFRQGLKRSTASANWKFSFLSSALGWPGDPYQTEIQFQAAALDAPQQTQYYSIYYGLGNWWDKSDNVLRLFAKVFAQPVEGNSSGIQGRMLWSVRNRAGEKATLAEFISEELEKYGDLDDSTLVRLVKTYRQLTDEAPPNLAKFDNRGVFIVIFRRSDAKTASEFESYFQSLRSKEYFDQPNVVGLSTREWEGKLYGVAVVGGFSAQDFVIETLQQDDKNSLDVAMPWPSPWNLEENGLPSDKEIDALQNRRN